MKLLPTSSCCALLAAATLSAPLTVTAAGTDCAFKKKVQKGSYTFSISSRPVGDCSIQVIRIAVQHSGRPLTQFANDPDVLAEDAWAHDLDNDGMPELAVVSRSLKDASRVTLDVYRLDNNMLRRVQLPELADRAGYRGHDSYRLDGNRVVRTFPVYREGDADGSPTGGSRTLRYELVERQLLPLGQETAPAVATPVKAAPQRMAAPEKPPATPVATAKTAAARTTVREIIAGASFVDIRIDGAVGKLRTFKLPDPQRLIIDIPGAVSALRSNITAIGNFGITRARAGAHKGYFRVVLEAAGASFPAHIVTTTDTGLHIDFAPAAAKP